MDEFELFRKIRILIRSQGRKVFPDHLAGLIDDLPYLLNDVCQGIEVSLISSNYAFPVPLVNIGAMIMIQEIVFSYGAHIRADTFAFLAQELFQGKALPFGCCLNNLCFDALIKTQTAGEVDRRS